jgi:hypothetical protein
MKHVISLFLLWIITPAVTSNQKEETARHDISIGSNTSQANRLLRRRREVVEDFVLGKEGKDTYLTDGGNKNNRFLKGKKSKSKKAKGGKMTKISKNKCKKTKRGKNGYNDCLDGPELDFDLQDCTTYDKTWTSDISESCYDTPGGGCQCPSAKELIESGTINCQVDRCPHDCAVCSFCLEEVLGCYDIHETSKPISTPSQNVHNRPSHVPSKTPTVPTAPLPDVPTKIPSVSFDLSICSTYAQRWLEDLGTTCLGDPQVNAGSCQCIDARSRIESGEILCGTSKCPDDCEVCKFCLNEVEDCNLSSTPSISPSVMESDSPTSFQKLYDLSDCGEYSPVWNFELIVHGDCKSAQELVKQGLLTCDSKCPDGCATCNLCLSKSIDCD